MVAINLRPADLEAFLALAETGSFRICAERLGLSQPGVSARIQHLEAALGVRLFDRTTRRVNITEAGERLRHRVEHTMAELRGLAQEFQDEAHLRRGRLLLGASPSVGASFLPRVMDRFRRRWPNIELVLHDDFFGRALERLTRGDVELAVIPFEPEQAGFSFDLLMTDDYAVALPALHPLAQAETVSLQEISALPLISLTPESAYWVGIRRAFAEIGQEFCPWFQTRNALTTIAMVRAGLGAALVTPIVCAPVNMEEVVIVPIRDARLTRRIGIVTVTGRTLGPPARAMIAQLRSLQSHRVGPVL